MTKNSVKKEDIKRRLKSYSKKLFDFSLKWLYLILLAGVAFYSFAVWDRSVVGSEWSEEKKQEYVKGQAVFSFGKNDYLNVVDLLKKRKENLEKHSGYEGRDIFYPEGF